MRFGNHVTTATKVLLADLMKNATQRNKYAQRWSQLTVDLFTTVVVRGGPAVCEFFAQNVGGPSLTTVHLNLKNDRHVLQPSFHVDNATFAAEFYSAVLKKLNREQGSVPFSVAVDETVIVPALACDGTFSCSVLFRVVIWSPPRHWFTSLTVTRYTPVPSGLLWTQSHSRHSSRVYAQPDCN